MPSKRSVTKKRALLALQSRFGYKPHTFYVVCPQNGTAVLKGRIPHFVVVIVDRHIKMQYVVAGHIRR